MPPDPNSNLIAMSALARAFSADHLHVMDLPYRFSSWALDDPGNLHLWADGAGRIEAWAVMQTPFWTVDYACDSRAGSSLHQQVLAWADRRAHSIADTPFGRPSWYVMAFADQASRIRDLEAAGFACQANVGEDSWSKVWMRHVAEVPVPAAPAPVGFTIRPLAGEAEVEAYVKLHRSVFGSRNMTVEWRARMLHCPEYVLDLDCVAVAPDGQLVAFCVGWLDSVSSPRRGQIEPMGVHPLWQRQGLGRALLAEVLRRLRACGAADVFVETDHYRDAAFALYQSLGFRVVRDVLVYRKDYHESSTG